MQETKYYFWTKTFAAKISSSVNSSDHIIYYKTMILQDFQIVLNKKDSCVLLEDNSVFLITDIFENIVSKQIFVKGKKFHFMKNHVLPWKFLIFKS